MSIRPNEVNNYLEEKVKARARLMQSKGMPLTKAKDKASKNIGFRDFQHLKRTKNNYEKGQKVEDLSGNDVSFHRDSKEKKCLVFDLKVGENSNLTKEKFTQITEDMKYLRKRDRLNFGSWYVAEPFDIECLKSLHCIANGQRTVLFEGRHTFAIKIDEIVFDWLKSYTFEEIITQI